MDALISWIDLILYIVFVFQVGYLTFFAVGALRHSRTKRIVQSKGLRYAVFFPAYKEDAVIFDSVSDFLKQDYPTELYDVYVISDRMKQETVARLKTLPLHVIEIVLEQGSKAKALTLAVDHIRSIGRSYNYAVIMDADNLACPDFLRQIDEAASSGYRAIQGHRVAKNRNTPTAILDAISEEINNTIFRQGQVNLGLSSALIGSGMALDYAWFDARIRTIDSMGEDKELERMLLKESIYTEYLPQAFVYDEKISSQSGFYNQRRRWIAAQIYTIKISARDLLGAIAQENSDYINKILQWMLFPRIILLGVLGLLTITCTIIAPMSSIKWWFLTFVLIYTLALAIPNYLITKEFKRSMFSLPSLFLLMFANLFRIKGANKKFIHTEHK